jgi:hypothetical protein
MHMHTHVHVRMCICRSENNCALYAEIRCILNDVSIFNMTEVFYANAQANSLLLYVHL